MLWKRRRCEVLNAKCQMLNEVTGDRGGTSIQELGVRSTDQPTLITDRFWQQPSTNSEGWHLVFGLGLNMARIWERCSGKIFRCHKPLIFQPSTEAAAGRSRVRKRKVGFLSEERRCFSDEDANMDEMKQIIPNRLQPSRRGGSSTAECGLDRSVVAAGLGAGGDEGDHRPMAASVSTTAGIAHTIYASKGGIGTWGWVFVAFFAVIVMLI